MQTDVKVFRAGTNGILLPAGGKAIRVKAVNFSGIGTDVQLVLRDGSATGAILFDMYVPTNTSPTYFLLPGEGVLFQNGCWIVEAAGSFAYNIYYG